jgi:hypothetical protein
MKRTLTAGLLFMAFFAGLSPAQVKAQAKEPAYKDMVGLNPTAEADIKVVSDLLNAFTSGDLDKARNLLAPGYLGHGPSPLDSVTADQSINNWRENYKTQLNRKVSFIPETFRVLQGDLKGNWVSIWGDYTFSSNGKTVTFPFQYTGHVTGGKVDRDVIYYDRLYIMQTLGYTLAPPAGR